MAEMRLALASGDVGRISEVYYQMWPEELPKPEAAIETFIRRQHPRSRFYYTSETVCGECNAPIYLCGGNWIHDDALHTCKLGKFAKGERVTGARPAGDAQGEGRK